MNNNKVRRSFLLSVFVIAAIAIAACTPESNSVKPPASPSPSPAATASPTASPAASPTGSPASTASKADALIGKWSGPEGTSVNVTKKGDKYGIDVTNLDGTKSFEGAAKGDVIEFSRNGKTETLKAATGAETGMKGFEKETNCVVITKGSEGYCKK